MAEKLDPIQWAHIKEQMEAHLVDMAKLAGIYYQGLLESGFPTEYAFILVRDYMNSIVNGGNDEEDSTD